jgi:hypothetical protein
MGVSKIKRKSKTIKVKQGFSSRNPNRWKHSSAFSEFSVPVAIAFVIIVAVILSLVFRKKYHHRVANNQQVSRVFSRLASISKI